MFFCWFSVYTDFGEIYCKYKQVNMNFFSFFFLFFKKFEKENRPHLVLGSWPQSFPKSIVSYLDISIFRNALTGATIFLPFRYTDEPSKQRDDREHGHHRRRCGCSSSACSFHLTGCLLHQHTSHSGSTILPHAGQKNNIQLSFPLR